jgi:hypothetical protein
MASIPTIESEVDFHVEGAGKPCKTVRYPLPSSHMLVAMFYALLSIYVQRLANLFQLEISLQVKRLRSISILFLCI